MKDVKIVKEKHIGGNVEYYYKNGNLIKKIDHTFHNPLVYYYNSDGTFNHMTTIERKSNKKLLFSIIGTLFILSYLYAGYKSNTYNPIQIIKQYTNE